ncbi:MAG: phosphoribosylanthranilate isomerase [Hyphomicrobiales bacterium]|nr:MAG: phosphoribosylanthranilate isomerase [Hyphomicrobiales bacterium]
MGFLIKICGLSDEASIDTAIGAGADMIGLVIFPPSPRNVSLEVARRLADHARGRTEIVALTVNADDALMDAVVEAIRPDCLQLHGKESPQHTAELGRRYGLPTMKALGISNAEDVARAGLYAGSCTRLLFDAKPPKDATRPGGLGATFDWRLLDALDPAVGFMLSGGLDTNNVADAIAATRAEGVDVSSGVESAPGIKDPDKIREFVAAARAAAVQRSAQ